jgi:hypothetical protein
MIPTLITLTWLSFVTIIVAACRVAARADAIELENHRSSRSADRRTRRWSCDERSDYGALAVMAGEP